MGLSQESMRALGLDSETPGWFEYATSPLNLMGSLGAATWNNEVLPVARGIGLVPEGWGSRAVKPDLSYEGLAQLAGLRPGSGRSGYLDESGQSIPAAPFGGIGAIYDYNSDQGWSRFVEKNPTAAIPLGILANIGTDPLSFTQLGALGKVAKGRQLLSGARDLEQAGALPSQIHNLVRPVVEASKAELSGMPAWRRIVNELAGAATEGDYFTRGSVFNRNLPDDLMLYGRGSLQAPRYARDIDDPVDAIDSQMERFSQMPGVKEVRRLSPTHGLADMEDGSRLPINLQAQADVVTPEMAEGLGLRPETVGAKKLGSLSGASPSEMRLNLTGEGLKTTPSHEYMHWLVRTGRVSEADTERLMREYRSVPNRPMSPEEFIATKWEQRRAGSILNDPLFRKTETGEVAARKPLAPGDLRSRVAGTTMFVIPGGSEGAPRVLRDPLTNHVTIAEDAGLDDAQLLELRQKASESKALKPAWSSEEIDFHGSKAKAGKVLPKLSQRLTAMRRLVECIG